MAVRPQPTFAECAGALLDVVRHNAKLAEHCDWFIFGLPTAAPGTTDAHKRWQRQTELVAWGQRYLEQMAGREAEHRALFPADNSPEELAATDG